MEIFNCRVRTVYYEAAEIYYTVSSVTEKTASSIPRQNTADLQGIVLKFSETVI